MNRFELFTLIFYALDDVWDDTHEEELGQFLSGANPFLFDDIGSADPAVFDDFKNKTSDVIEVKDSYVVAADYIKSLKNKKISEAFFAIDEKEWIKSVNDYLSEAKQVE